MIQMGDHWIIFSHFLTGSRENIFKQAWARLGSALIGWIRLLTWQIGVVIQQTIINSLTSTEHSQHLIRTPIGPTMGLSVTGCLVHLVWWVRFLCSPPGRQAQSHPNTPCSGEHSQTSRASATPRAASYTQHPPLYTLVWYWTQDLTRQGMTWCDN